MNTASHAAVPPVWLRADVPLTLLLDLACMEEPGYPAILGTALAREGVSEVSAAV